MFKTRPLSEAFGIEILDLDLSKPLPSDRKASLRKTFDENGLLLLRHQQMTKADLVAATYNFGEPEIHPLRNAIDPEVPEILIISTRGTKGDVLPDNDDDIVGQIDWHTDFAYMTVPNRGALIYGVQLPPEGGQTGFVDRQKTYEALSADLKARIEGLTVIQSWRFAQEGIAKNPSFRTDEGAKMLALNRFPDLAYPLVYVHPMTGKKVLNISPQYSAAIAELPGRAGRSLLDELIAHSTQPRFIYWHTYQAGDLVIWDNWRAMHAASGTKGRFLRLMYRTTIKGSVQFGRQLETSSTA